MANERSHLLSSYKDIPIKHISIDESFGDEEKVTSQNTSNNKGDKKIIYLIAFTSAFGIFLIYCMLTSVHVHHNDHTIPTLLQIRLINDDDNDTAKVVAASKGGDAFVNSLSSELYDDMKRATFIIADIDSHGDNDKEASYYDEHDYKINIDKHFVSFHQNITVTWKDDDTSNQLNSNDDVIALYCPATETDPKKFKDAATIAQVKTTNIYRQMKINDIDGGIEGSILNGLRRRTSRDTTELLNNNEWLIPSFPIIREDTCEFRLWIRQHTQHHDTGPIYKLGATTGSFGVEKGTSLPTTIHLALTSHPSDIMVHFSTNLKDGIPIVLYHTDEDIVMNGYLNLGLDVRKGHTTTYEAKDMCQEPANIEEPGKFSSPGMLHSVTMENLEPDTKYYYKVGVLKKSDSVKGDISNENESELLYKDVVWSAVYSFNSPISTTPSSLVQETKLSENDSSSYPFTFLVYADQGAMGYGNNDGGDRTSSWSNREIEMNNIRSVHHFGDLSYAQGAGHMWDTWLDMVSVFSAKVPLMVGIGNHEYDHTDGGQDGKDPSGIKTKGGFRPRWGDFATDSNGECGVPVAKRFIMPANGNGVFWYSFNYGNVHTIMLSSEHDLSKHSEQYQWFENDLKSVNRTLIPWIIIETHRPMYNNEDIPKNTKVGVGMRNEFENLLYDYGVDLFLAGHYHSYMRSCSGLYKGQCKNGGPIHITIGTAGAALDRVPLLRSPWAEKYFVQWGYGRITVNDDSSLRWDFVADTDGEVKDTITISK
mmetsp:Transcript_18585/g.22772  ORF Transcript_18585/g.22772 Transcript_18585/m.22772 type:complete len:764 (-) Transcript_18585:40-2331(-)